MNEKSESDGLDASFVIRKPSPTDMSLCDKLDLVNRVQQIVLDYYASKHGKGE